MTEFIHVHLIDKRPVGSNLGHHIPLHMTVLHWFQSERDPQEIIERTKSALASLPKISVNATTDDLFGPDRNIPVMKLSKTEAIVQLHQTLKDAMEELGAKFDQRWTGALKWSPHVTHKQDKRLYPRDQVVIGDIDLITRSSKNGNRIILQRFRLSS